MSTQYVGKNGEVFKRRRDGDFATDWEPIDPMLLPQDNAFMQVSPKERDFTDDWDKARAAAKAKQEGGK